MSETSPNQKTITVQTEAGEVIVRKMALGDYAGVLRALDKLPKAIGQITNRDKTEITNDYILGLLPELLADHMDELAGVLAAATNRDGEFFTKQLDLADTIEVFAAIFELNDYTRVVNVVKKLMAARQPKKPDSV